MNACIETAPRTLGAPEPVVHLDPAPARWPELLAPHALSDEQRRFREQLALPTDRPIIMGGHQTHLWHPGILAKLLAANELGARTGSAVAWLAVDLDDHDVFRVPFPEHDARGQLARGWWNAAAGNVSANAPGTPAFAKPAVHPAPLPADTAQATMPHWVRARLELARAALAGHADAPNAATQVTSALFDLLDPITPRPLVVYASRLAHTDLFTRTMAHLRANPAGAHATYNDAVSRFPDARVRALGADPTRGVELPLWRVDEHGVRRPVFAADLSRTPDDAFIPRGMLMSALVRLAGCDLFIHGTGGRAYEPINDAWIGAWLDGVRPAPFVVASADLLLPLGGRGATDAEARTARWRAHHARHHPADVGDDAAERERDALVHAIAALPFRSPERAAGFADLHRLLAGYRRAHAPALAALAAAADDTERRAAERLVREDRAWPGVLHDRASVLALRARVERAFATP